MKKLLLVEDDAIMLRMYRRLFSFGGFEVIATTDGIQALQHAKTLIPDVIILDVMIPKMNGLELLATIKRDATIKHIPTVMLTNLAMDNDIKNALSLGAALYLIKNDHEPRNVYKMIKNLV